MPNPVLLIQLVFIVAIYFALAHPRSTTSGPFTLGSFALGLWLVYRVCKSIWLGGGIWLSFPLDVGVRFPAGQRDVLTDRPVPLAGREVQLWLTIDGLPLPGQWPVLIEAVPPDQAETLPESPHSTVLEPGRVWRKCGKRYRLPSALLDLTHAAAPLTLRLTPQWDYGGPETATLWIARTVSLRNLLAWLIARE